MQLFREQPMFICLECVYFHAEKFNHPLFRFVNKKVHPKYFSHHHSLQANIVKYNLQLLYE